MKQIVDYRVLISIDGGKFEDTSIWKHLSYEEPKEERITELNTFAEAYEAIKNDKIMNAVAGYTFFRSRPQIELSTANWDCRKTMTEKNFKKITVKEMWATCNEKNTIKGLASMLSAEEFCEWLKDHGISQIPTNF